MPVDVIQLVAIVSDLESAGAGPDGLELTVTGAHLQGAVVRVLYTIMYVFLFSFFLTVRE